MLPYGNIAFVNVCLLYCTPCPFWKVVFSKSKEFASRGVKGFSFRVDPFSEGETIFDRVTSSESVSILLNTRNNFNTFVTNLSKAQDELF